jgi:hypothetical protein
MTNTVLKFGVYSGLVSAALMLATVPFMNQIGFDKGLFVGYTAMLISFLFVYFGVRSYRDTVLGGRMTFATGFNVGIMITLISCVFYVATWLVVYFFLMPDFAAKFGEFLLESAKAKGASPAELEVTARQAAEYQVLLDNPLTNAAYSFIEPFPVGLLVTLISAAILRKPAAAHT